MKPPPTLKSRIASILLGMFLVCVTAALLSPFIFHFS